MKHQAIGRSSPTQAVESCSNQGGQYGDMGILARCILLYFVVRNGWWQRRKKNLKMVAEKEKEPENGELEKSPSKIVDESLSQISRSSTIHPNIGVPRPTVGMIAVSEYEAFTPDLVRTCCQPTWLELSICLQLCAGTEALVWNLEVELCAGSGTCEFVYE